MIDTTIKEMVAQFDATDFQMYGYLQGILDKKKLRDFIASSVRAEYEARDREVLDELERRLGTHPFQTGSELQWDRGVMFHWQGVKNWIAEMRELSAKRNSEV